ncbi:MAG: hypothetical protein JJU45_03940 [Acidimicrobiia bacterium]|nr:hypothetical protein [Acidimicrobiia bacterium]
MRRRGAAPLPRVRAPPQPNRPLTHAAAVRGGGGLPRGVGTGGHTANTSAASIPMALAEAADAGRLTTGDKVLLVGFGAGMSWASAVVRWDGQEQP